VPIHPPSEVLDGLQVVLEDAQLRLGLEVLHADPSEMRLRLGGLARVTPAVPQKELPEVMARRPLGTLGRFASPLDVPHRLGSRVGDVDLGEVPGHEEPSDGATQDAVDARCRQIAVQPMTRRPSRVAAFPRPNSRSRLSSITVSLAIVASVPGSPRPGSATATDMLSPWTSRPTNRTLSMVGPASRCGFAPLGTPQRSNPRSRDCRFNHSV
jgi:hypothetical protein